MLYKCFYTVQHTIVLFQFCGYSMGKNHIQELQGILLETETNRLILNKIQPVALPKRLLSTQKNSFPFIHYSESISWRSNVVTSLFFILYCTTLSHCKADLTNIVSVRTQLAEGHLYIYIFSFYNYHCASVTYGILILVHFIQNPFSHKLLVGLFHNKGHTILQCCIKYSAHSVSYIANLFLSKIFQTFQDN